MFTNYIKLAVKVLGRRTFFTFISLFGISFTLMILIVSTAFLDNELGANAPLTEKDKIVFLTRLIMTNEVVDTVYQIDSMMVDGLMTYDTITTEDNRQNSYSSSSMSYSFLDKYMRDITGAKTYTFYSSWFSFDLFVNSNKLTFEAIFTDANFWSVYDFSFTQGRPFNAGEVESQAPVVVLTTEAALDYFGTTEQVLGKQIEMDGRQYEIIGLIEPVKTAKGYITAHTYLPITHTKPVHFNYDGFHGPFEAAYLANSEKGRQDIHASIAQKAALIPIPDPDNYNNLRLLSFNFFDRYAYYIFPNNDNPESSKRYFFIIVGGLSLLFILLPTLNLININVSRIMERSSEIGVRKAFGAHSGTILVQFIFENVIITLIGGIIGFIMAYIALRIINNSNVLENAVLQFNYRIFFFSVLICLAFGIISGLLPAYRMSKLQIINALKQNKI